MKKLLFVAGVAVIGFSAAFAQEVKQSVPASTTKQESRAADHSTAGKIAPEKIAQRKTERLDKEISLTADQKQKAYAIFLKDAEVNKGRAVQHEETEKEIKSLLTAEQNTTYEMLKEERKRSMMNEGASNRSTDQKRAPSNKL